MQAYLVTVLREKRNEEGHTKADEIRVALINTVVSYEYPCKAQNGWYTNRRAGHQTSCTVLQCI